MTPVWAAAEAVSTNPALLYMGLWAQPAPPDNLEVVLFCATACITHLAAGKADMIKLVLQHMSLLADPASCTFSCCATACTTHLLISILWLVPCLRAAVCCKAEFCEGILINLCILEPPGLDRHLELACRPAGQTRKAHAASLAYASAENCVCWTCPAVAQAWLHRPHLHPSTGVAHSSPHVLQQAPHADYLSR